MRNEKTRSSMKRSIGASRTGPIGSLCNKSPLPNVMNNAKDTVAETVTAEFRMSRNARQCDICHLLLSVLPATYDEKRRQANRNAGARMFDQWGIEYRIARKTMTKIHAMNMAR
jgi:hypothetical protein